MLQNQTTKPKAQKVFTGIWIVLMIIVLIFSLRGFNAKILQGDLFSGGSVPSNPANFYLESYNADPGETGDILLKSNTDYNNIRGLEFTLVFNANQVNIPANQIQDGDLTWYVKNSNLTSPGHLKVVAVATAAQNIGIGQTLLKLDGLVISNNLAEGEEIELAIEDFEIAYNDTSGTLQSDQTQTVTSGTIIIGGNQNQLKLIGVHSENATQIRLNFDDFIISPGTVGDFQIATFQTATPLNVMQVEIATDDGKALILKTAEQTQDQIYQITVDTATIQGNVLGYLNPNYNQGYFTGEAPVDTVNNFNLLHAQATSGSGLSLTFNHELNGSSLYPESFIVFETLHPENRFAINNLQLVSPDQVNLTLTGSILTTTGWIFLEASKNYQIKIQNSGIATDLRDTNNHVLAQNIITFPGFNALPDQLDLLQATALAPDRILLTFSENLAANTVTASDFQITGAHVQSVEVPYEGDYAQVLLTLNNQLPVDQYYVATVTEITAFSSKPLGSNNATVFYVDGTVSATRTLKLLRASVLAKDQVSLSFNEAVNPDTVRPVDFKILDQNGQTLTIIASNLANNTTVNLTTAVQKEKALYTVLATQVKNQNMISVSSQNNAIFFGYSQITPSITDVQPTQIQNDQAGTIVITGQNFESGTQVFFGSTKMESTLTNTQIDVNVPVGFTTGVYDLRLVRPNGESIVRSQQILVEVPPAQITVHSADSYASPYKVPNDGSTQTTLWVLVSDPMGVDDIEKVTLDLRPINGVAAADMTAGEIVPGQTVDFQRWYFLNITVPPTVSTSQESTTLEATLQNKSGDKAFGSVEFQITRNTTSSVAPQITQAYASPGTLVPWDDTEVYFYAYVEDEDGAETIDNVVVNLVPLGGWPQLMSPLSAATTGSGGSTAATGGIWYQTTTAFKAPFYLKNNNYTLSVTATDQTGETATAQFQVKVSKTDTGPSIDTKRFYVTPRNRLPNDNQTTFGVQAYITDPNGIEDIVSVTLDLEDIGLAPVQMTTPETQADAQGAWYQVSNLTIPKEVITGIQILEVIVTDKSGAEDSAELEIEVTKFDEMGDAPIINDERSYSVPQIVYNDGSTPFSLYAFVQDKDLNIDYVVANLGNIAQVSSWSGATFNTGDTSPDTAHPCLSNSPTMRCMTPSLKEGNTGQWFILSDLTIPTTTLPSMEPYRIWITAVDQTGKSNQGYINLNVSNAQLPDEKTGNPPAILATAIAKNKVELVFAKQLYQEDLKNLDSAFKITEKMDTTQNLKVLDATLNAEGNIMTLTTEEQKSNLFYTVATDPEKLGMLNTRVSDTVAHFHGYQHNTARPEIVKAAPLTSFSVEVAFNVILKPSSIFWDGGNFEITEKNNPTNRLKVFNAKFNGSDTIYLTTDLQSSSREYILTARNLLSASDRPVSVDGTSVIFRGFKRILKSAATLTTQADFDGNGRIDFTDFTMFASVYGEFVQALENAEDDASVEAIQNEILNTEPFPDLPTTEEVPYGYGSGSGL